MRLKKDMAGKTQPPSLRNYWAFAAGIAFAILFLVFHWTTPGKDRKQLKGSTVKELGIIQKAPSSLIQSEVSGIPYYHCHGEGASSSLEISIILLHGARFTKEDWKTSGILQDVCSRKFPGKLSVFAVDLPTKADFQDLMKLLDEMESKKLIRKPVTLVTPSAGGRTMVSWTVSPTAKETIPKYVSKWIPVAANSINNTPDQVIPVLAAVETLAIYGDQDIGGKISSEKLKSLANAKVVELRGSHPCYIDSPKEFVDEVMKFVET